MAGTIQRVVVEPKGLGKPLGPYAHALRVRAGELLFIAGQVAVDRSGAVVGKNDFRAQTMQVFANLHAVLAEVGATFEHIVQFTTFLVRSQDIEAFFAVRQERYPQMFPSGAYPPNTLLIIDRLVKEEFLIEIEAIAALP